MEPITYTWDLGDGTTASGAIVTHIYTATGGYTVVLTATNCTTATATAVHTITVVPACLPLGGLDFSWLPVTPTVDEEVAFTGTVATGDEPITYTWKLEVGGWKEGQVVTHSYALPGLYTVWLTATNCATATATALHTLTVVLPPPTCTAGAILSVTTDISGCAVTLGAELSGDPPFTYLWDFGPFGTSTATNPRVDFQTSGTYTGTLNVWNCGNMEPIAWSFAVDVTCQEYFIYLPLVLKGYP
jgi:PKD repeat protein